MQGLIEFHGAKQMLVCAGVAPTQIESNQYIPGDTVYMYTDKTSFLVQRRAQAVVGITKERVNGTSVLYIPNFGTVCKFSPVLNLFYGFVKTAQLR